MLSPALGTGLNCCKGGVLRVGRNSAENLESVLVEKDESVVCAGSNEG